MSINIGNNNTIKNSTISEGSSLKAKEDSKKNIIERHPILTSIICSLVAGFIMMFSFWQEIIEFIERVV